MWAGKLHLQFPFKTLSFHFTSQISSSTIKNERHMQQLNNSFILICLQFLFLPSFCCSPQLARSWSVVSVPSPIPLSIVSCLRNLKLIAAPACLLLWLLLWLSRSSFTVLFIPFHFSCFIFCCVIIFTPKSLRLWRARISGSHGDGRSPWWSLAVIF